VKRISEQVRELRPSDGMRGDYSYCHGWSEGVAKASELIETLEEVGVIERGREIECGYCECVIYCEPEDPSEEEQAAAKKAFLEHDSTCELNPLVVKVREALAELRKLEAQHEENHEKRGADEGVFLAFGVAADILAERFGLK
jgi:hypothetical protein